MYTYAYSKEAVDSSLTSSGTFSSYVVSSTTYGAASYTTSYIDLSTYQTYSISTYTSGQTYTITDYTSTTTSTCDYSATTSSSAGSTAQSGAVTSTTNYITISHSTNGTHSITERTKIASLYSSSVTSYTENCAYNYFDTQATSNSVAYGTTRTLITGSTIYHTPFGTHTVSSSTRDIYLNIDSSITYTGYCDFSESSSIMSTTGSSDFGGYSQYTTISTIHDTYGYHTVVSRTLELGSSNASQTKSVTYFSENTTASYLTYYGVITRTAQTVDSQTYTNSLSNIGSSTSGTYSGGYTGVSSTVTQYTSESYRGVSFTLSGVTDGNSIGYEKGIFFTDISATSYVSYSLKTNAYSLYDTSYYQPEVTESASITGFSLSEYYTNYETLVYVENGQKKYTTISNNPISETNSSSSVGSQGTTFYSSTRQTSSQFGNASISTTKSSQLFSASITSTTASSTQTFTTGSSSGTTTRTSTRTYSGFGTTFTNSSHTVGTINTSATSTFSSNKSINWWTKYLRDNGEILFVPSRTSAVTGSYYPLSEAGSTASIWSNDSISKTTSKSTYIAGVYYTQESASTWTVVQSVNFYLSSEGYASISPWYASQYGAIENAYAFSSSSYNPDTSIFSMREYADTRSSNTYSITYNGYFLLTSQSLGGPTSTTTYNYSVSQITESGNAKKIKPMSYFLQFTNSIYPTVMAYSTSNTVLKI